MKHEKKPLHSMVDAAMYAKYLASIYDETDLIILGRRVWLNRQAAVTCMHVTDRTLREWVRKRILRKARVGGKVYYLEADLSRIMNRAMRFYT